ncbi:ESX secretion-associated protein EspG [Amycolatopsis benzoatilytica]|uniref:ESX secretion-associated protein EspG n=1 Tax=Amycolatopsis benzoatilytica TaxID=346045 RepID=UPI00036709AC|nr:ESX secretion-associated protein EspG [Amycolatopsis benzoatilytica]
MVLSRTTEITLSTILGAFREVRLGEPHPVFGGGAVHVPESLATELDDEARGELTQLGLSDRRGRVTDEFEDALYALGQADTEYFARYHGEERHYSVLVATRGHNTVTAVVAGEKVWVKAEDSRQSPAAVLVANLPASRPAQLTTISLSQQELRGEDSDDPGDRSRTARTVDALLNQPASGRGEVNVAVREQGWHRQEVGGVLLFRDLAEGRALFELSGPAQNRYVTVMPGEDQLFVRKVAALRASWGS